jgi:hypothetical protein
VFVDPPYNVPIDGHVSGLGRHRHGEFAMASGEMSEAEFVGFLERALGHHVAHSVDGAIHFVCMDWRHLGELLAAGRSLYSEFKNLCVWEKTKGCASVGEPTPCSFSTSTPTWSACARAPVGPSATAAHRARRGSRGMALPRAATGPRAG